MPQIKPEYEEVTEFPMMASKLVKKYPEVFDDLDINSIRCVAITNKERSSKKRRWEVKAVSMPIKMDCAYSYYIIIYNSDWTEMEEKNQVMLVAAALLAIPTDSSEEGKTNPFDLKDFDLMIRTFGVGYLDNDKIPNLINENVNWQLIDR